MANSCVFIPSKGANLFRQLRRQFGYEQAVQVFYTAINPQFIADYRNLQLDEEGIPTFESLMKNRYIQQELSDNTILKSLNTYQAVDDTMENYEGQLQTAMAFNQSSPFNDRFIAVVEKGGDKIKVSVVQKTKQALERFQNQYASNLLNHRLETIFSPIGVTVGQLSAIETQAGRVGVTDFSVARSIASDFGSIIRVANNMEGAQAVSEEFSHLILGVFREDPLIQRSINLLSTKPELLKELLGDDYEDTVKFYSDNMLLVAEEALGHILQDHLISQEGEYAPTIVQRALAKITKEFKDYDLQELEQAIIDADAAMSSLAKGVLNGTKTITQEDIVNSRREVQFNALSNTIDRNIDILKQALNTEQKRFKITDGQIKSQTADVISEIKKNLLPNADVVYGLLTYASGALQQLRYLQAEFNNIGNLTPSQKFGVLRKARLYTQSYGQFINSLNDAISEDKENGEMSLLADFEINGETINLGQIIKDLNDLNTSITRSFFRHAKPAFAEFLKPFLGENLTIRTGNHAGEQISIEQLLNEANSDISFTDRWLDAMGDSADVLLQLFDAAVKEAKDKARVETIKNITAIQNLRMEAEKLGITDFEWMFERDNDGHKGGNYISEVNFSQYQKDRREFMKSIEDKYGANPTGTDALAKIQEIRNWHSVHSTGFNAPNPTFYHNDAYDRLTDNQKTILDKFLAMKKLYDNKLPKNRVDLVKAIQIRKSQSQRLLDSMTSPSTLFANIKENMASAILDREDDDQVFGTASQTKSLTSFDGREFMTLPVLYTSRLANPDELSTDIFASLMAYAYMANNYEQMDAIIDQLEVGRDIVEDSTQRKVKQTRGNKEVIEKFRAKNETVTNFVYGRQSNIVSKLDDFLESQVYQRYLKDEGTFGVFGKKVNIQKLTTQVLKHSSIVQLGFNWLANLANVTTGVAMQNIEAACGQYFSAGELFKADKEYTAAMKDFAAELASRNKKSKLALFDQLFNVKQDYGGSIRGNQKKNWFQRIFGTGWAFIGQEAGDHWLYNRTAIAMALRTKVKVPNKGTISLWEALQTRDKFEGNHDIKELYLPEGTTLENGNPVDINKLSRQIAHVNQSLFGIYNQDDAMAANRVAMGRLLMQYRKWIKPQMNKRFQAGQYSVVMDAWEEGYYRTVLRLGNDLLRGKVQLGTCWSSMQDFEKKNVIRALTEMVQFFAIWALANWIEWPDDKKRPWAVKLAEYSVKRLAHETGGLAPSTVMIQENLKTIKDPIASIGVVTSGLNLFNSLISPEDWTDEISSGPYKGLSTLQKNISKAPLPGIAQYRQIDKFVGELDNSINYYARPSY